MNNLSIKLEFERGIPPADLIVESMLNAIRSFRRRKCHARGLFSGPVPRGLSLRLQSQQKQFRCGKKEQ